MKGFRDIELISAYLDGQLDPSDSARLESRIATDPELVSALNDLRLARAALYKLPARKAPRNFMLTRKMVGVKPPMPRTFSFFRFSSAIATLLLMVTFAFNLLGTHVSFGAAAPAPEFGYGGGPGMGGGCGEPCGFDPSLQMPAVATEAPAATSEPSMESLVVPTELPPSLSEDSMRASGTPTPEAMAPKEGEANSTALDQPEVRNRAPVIPFEWQAVLLIVSLISAAITFFIHRAAKRKWN